MIGQGLVWNMHEHKQHIVSITPRNVCYVEATTVHEAVKPAQLHAVQVYLRTAVNTVEVQPYALLGEV